MLLNSNCSEVMKRYFVCLMAACSVFAGCKDLGTGNLEVESSSANIEKIKLSVEITSGETADVKSILPEDTIEDKVTEITLASYDEDGFLVDTQYYTDVGEVVIYLSRSGPNTLYALANMGDMTGSMPREAKDIGNLCYELDTYSAIAKKGMPMCCSMEASVSMKKPVIRLVRLLAKVRMRILHTSLSSASSSFLYAYNLCNVSAYVRQANRRLYPFSPAGSRALSSEDIMTESDYNPDLNDREEARKHYTDSEMGPGPGFFQDTTIVFYVPENMQGKLLPVNADPMEKTGDRLKDINGKDYSGLCTYLELNTMKVAAGSGTSGTVTYRCYLGGDTTTDFNVERNGRYDVVLDLTPEGFSLDNWKVVRGDDWTDVRILRFLNDSYQIFPGGNKDVFVYYHRSAGGQTNSEYRPDDWVYSFDDKAMADAGISYSLNSSLKQSPDSKMNFCFTFKASSSARKGAGFPLTVMSRDGALVDHSMIYVSDPGQVSAEWTYVPSYVSQCGEVTLKGMSADVPVNVNLSDSRIAKVTSLGGNRFKVVATAPGSTVLTFTGSDGLQTYSQTLSVNAPLLRLGSESIALDPDGKPAVLGYRYVDFREQELTNVDNDAFRKYLFPVISGDPYFSAQSGYDAMNLMISRLKDDAGNQIDAGTGYDLAVTAKDCLGCGTLILKAYVVDPFDGVGVMDYGRIDDYTLMTQPGVPVRISGKFKDKAADNARHEYEAPVPAADPSYLKAELRPRWKNGFSNDNQVFSLSYLQNNAFGTGASFVLVQNTVGAQTKHGAGKHDFILSVINRHSGESLEHVCGSLDVYVHAVMGARAEFGHQECDFRPQGADPSSLSFAGVYNRVAGRDVFSVASGKKIYYMDVKTEFLADVNGVYVFDRLLAASASGSDVMDAQKVLLPSVADGQTVADTRMLYSVNGTDGQRIVIASEDAGRRRGVGTMLYRALYLKTSDSVHSDDELKEWFFGVDVNGEANKKFSACYEARDVKSGKSVDKSNDWHFTPSSYPGYVDSEGKGYHVIHFLDVICPETCGWINLL